MADTDPRAPTTSRKRRFGRRKESDGPVRSDDEWVDTLAVQPGAQHDGHEMDDGRSPFDTAGLEETGPGSYGQHGSEVPPMPASHEEHTGRAYGGHHGSSAIADDTPVPRRGWHRRSHESIDEIETYIDGVLGTANDPRYRRRAVSAADLGIGRTKGDGFVKTSVEGLPDDVPLALPFPHDELRSARLVYETEGGYVIEIERAVGGSERDLDRQYYTVSRIGRVEQVLDRMRGIASREPDAGSSRTTKTQASAYPVNQPSSQPQGHEPLPDDLPETSTERGPVADEQAYAPHDDHTAHHGADAHPAAAAEPAATTPAGVATPEPYEAQEASPADHAAPAAEPYAHDAPTQEAPDEDAAADDGRARRFGLFGRKRGDDGGLGDDGAPDAADVQEAESFADGLPESAGSGSRSFGLFGRKRKGTDQADDEDGGGHAEPVPPAP